MRGVYFIYPDICHFFSFLHSWCSKFPLSIISLLLELLPLAILLKQQFWLWINSLSFSSFYNVLILPACLKNILRKYRILHWQSFLSWILDFMVCHDKSAGITVPLYKSLFFGVVFSLSLAFSSLIMMSPAVHFSVHSLFGVAQILKSDGLNFFPNVRSLQSYIFFSFPGAHDNYCTISHWFLRLCWYCFPNLFSLHLSDWIVSSDLS